MTPTPDTRHLNPEEIELWAQGLLPAARDPHSLDNRSDLLSIGSGVHPERAANGAGNSV